MRNNPKPLAVHNFGQSDPLAAYESTLQGQYLRDYLGDLGAKSVVEEPNYFDRDYLAEFSTFFSVSAAGYPNVCRRVHFFDTQVSQKDLVRFARSNLDAVKKLADHYLGFVVIRPLPLAPFGRTVVQWYPDTNPKLERITEPSRLYHINLLGNRLSVRGLAWQQQDAAVSACATIGIWTMLHSSAFDDHHAIPTTSEITLAAHRFGSFGQRIFPSHGLHPIQICEAISAQGLAPLSIHGDIPSANAGFPDGFTRARFASLTAALVSSGYPMLVICDRVGVSHEQHAVVVTGFRSCTPVSIPQGQIAPQDTEIPYVYLHDDNIGPHVRHALAATSATDPVKLKPEAPPIGPFWQRNYDATAKVSSLVPKHVLVAVHDQLRLPLDQLEQSAKTFASNISSLLSTVASRLHVGVSGVSYSVRFFKLADYLRDELSKTLLSNPRALGQVRRRLQDRVAPMSLHIGVIRVGLDDATLLADVLVDSTNGRFAFDPYAAICFNHFVFDALNRAPGAPYGQAIKAYS